MQLVIPGTPDAVQRAISGLATHPACARLSPDTVMNAEIVLAEVMNNIVEHAYAAVSGDITVTLRPTDRGLDCILTDCGAAMPGLALPEGAFQPLGDIDDLPEGGFGWFLIRSLVEDLSYQRQDGKNRLSFLLLDEQ